ncbi:protein NCBP2AS2 homolog [Antedon mediterranea]|uniref:protein NCBP2AS2 homolog n=1 Tax=Antedon mediterranea TaxID=105859 RepID=UPI003AF8AD2C
MIFRILRYLVHNEQLIEKLSESRVMRRVAQMTVYSMNKANEIGHDAIEKVAESESIKKFSETEPQDDNRISSFSRTFMKEMQEGLKEMNDDIQKKKH